MTKEGEPRISCAFFERHSSNARLGDNTAVVSEKHGLIYTVRLKIERDTMNVNGSEISLLPGMVVTAEVQTDERKIASYFIRPTKRYLE